MKRWLSNRPWKAWKTRKFSFIYCIVLGTIIIGVGAVALFCPGASFDTATWMTESLNFCKFIIATGTALILLPLNDFLEVFGKKKKASDDECEGPDE